MENLTLEQKIVYHLAKKGYITNVAEVTKALKDVLHAEKLLTLEGDAGIKDDIKEEIQSGNIDIEGVTGECDHEALTNEEIQEVFDNDNEEVNS